jgi:hypothetical protein
MSITGAASRFISAIALLLLAGGAVAAVADEARGWAPAGMFAQYGGATHASALAAGAAWELPWRREMESGTLTS